MKDQARVRTIANIAKRMSHNIFAVEAAHEDVLQEANTCMFTGLVFPSEQIDNSYITFVTNLKESLVVKLDYVTFAVKTVHKQDLNAHVWRAQLLKTCHGKQFQKRKLDLLIRNIAEA